MKLVTVAVTSGILGTLVMDALNFLCARVGLILKIDAGMIGRMAAGWSHGRFRYRSPGEMEKVRHETFWGYWVHYGIGVALAIPYVVGCEVLIGGSVSPIWALAYGIATTVASWFFVYPSMGFGAFGLRSPDPLKAPISSLANHLFYGLGLAATVAVV